MELVLAVSYKGESAGAAVLMVPVAGVTLPAAPVMVNAPQGAETIRGNSTVKVSPTAPVMVARGPIRAPVAVLNHTAQRATVFSVRMPPGLAAAALALGANPIPLPALIRSSAQGHQRAAVGRYLFSLADSSGVRTANCVLLATRADHNRPWRY